MRQLRLQETRVEDGQAGRILRSEGPSAHQLQLSSATINSCTAVYKVYSNYLTSTSTTMSTTERNLLELRQVNGD